MKKKKEENLKEYYENIFRKSKENQENLFKQPNSQFKELVNKFKHKDQKKALDLGYGAGNYTKYLLDSGFSVVSVDMVDKSIFSNKCIEEIKSKKLKIVEMDINDYNSQQKIDFLVCKDVLHYLKRENVEKILKNITDNTNKNGYHYLVVFTDINRKDENGKQKIIENEANFSLEDIIKLVKKYYKDWDVKINVKSYKEKDKFSDTNDYYFRANQITIIAKKI